MSQVNQVPRERNLMEEEKLYPKIEEYNPLLRKQEKSPTSLILTILKNVKIGQDLTSFDTPVSLLSGKSALETLGDAYRPSQAIHELFTEEVAEQRLLLVMKHMLQNFTSIVSNTVSHSKPFNPILGEQLFMHWKGEDDSIFNFVGEQVSHHPPVSAFTIKNEKHNFETHCTLGSKITFKGNSVEANYKGYRCIMHKHPKTGEEEHYEINGDSAQGTGIFIGTARFGFCSTMTIYCREHPEIMAQVTFSDVSKVKGKLKRKKSPKSKKYDEKLYRFTGDLLKVITLEDCMNKTKSEWIALGKLKNYQKTMPQLLEMNPLESRLVWHDVYVGLETQQEEMAQAHKHYVENTQRAKRKERKEKGEVWKPEYFDELKTSPNNILPHFKINEKGTLKINNTQKFKQQEVSDDELD